MKDFLAQHVIHWILGGGLTLIFVAVAHALPEPLPMGNQVYTFLYKFLQYICTNKDKL